jgi:hypothetical protein
MPPTHGLACTTGPERRITRWEHEHVLEAVQQRLDENPQAMRVRRETVEHPFGTLKMRMGATHHQIAHGGPASHVDSNSQLRQHAKLSLASPVSLGRNVFTRPRPGMMLGAMPEAMLEAAEPIRKRHV